jgi:hypothetical protein
MSEVAAKAPRSQRAYNTNLASEFHVMSVLYRLGLDANLTLGNKKAVDIVVVIAPGDTITIDVKAVAGAVDWLVGSTIESPRDRHFVVLFSYEGKFAELDKLPQAWVLPHKEFLPWSRRRKRLRSCVMCLALRYESWNIARMPGMCSRRGSGPKRGCSGRRPLLK